MNIKVRDLKQTETIKNSDKLMVLVDDELNLVKNITKEEFLTNIISTSDDNALVQDDDGNLYVNKKDYDYGDDSLLPYITNCLLEVPQNINLQIIDGTLTLKAGSIGIFPNGFEADGRTRKFDYLPVPSDKTSKPAYTRTNGIVFTNRSFSIFADYPHAYSGPTAPTGEQYMLWYDTANNLVKRTADSGATWISDHSLPYGLVNCGANGYTEITQVFNGMGFIGSTVWVDKGVEGLAPKLRNADGTLNNVKVSSSRVQIYTNTDSTWSATNVGYVLTVTNSLDRRTQSTYNAMRNINVTINGVEEVFCKLADCTIVNGTITTFSPVLPFRAADAQDLASYLPLTGGKMSGPLELQVYNRQTPFAIHKTQNQQDAVRIIEPNFNIDNTTPASSTLTSRISFVTDKNNLMVGQSNVNYNTAAEYWHLLSSQRRINNSYKIANLGVGINASGNPITYAPAVTNQNGIVTQTALSKATSGYIKLGCGIIIQWGRNNNGVVTFPVPFSNASSYMVTLGTEATQGSHYGCTITSRTATTFSLVGNYTYTTAWIAVGY